MTRRDRLAVLTVAWPMLALVLAVVTREGLFLSLGTAGVLPAVMMAPTGAVEA